MIAQITFFWRGVTLPFRRYHDKTEKIIGTLFLNSDKLDPSEDKSYIFTQDEFHEVYKTYKLIVTMLALFHSSWQQVCLSVVLSITVTFTFPSQWPICLMLLLLKLYPSFNPFLDVWVWDVFRDFVNTQCLYWPFPQPQLLWITKHHLLTIIIRLGICHTKSFNSSHWRPGYHFTHSAAKNSFGWNGTTCCW